MGCNEGFDLSASFFGEDEMNLSAEWLLVQSRRDRKKSARYNPISPAPAANRCGRVARVSAPGSQWSSGRLAAACSCGLAAPASLEKFHSPPAAACLPLRPDILNQ